MLKAFITFVFFPSNSFWSTAYITWLFAHWTASLKDVNDGVFWILDHHWSRKPLKPWKSLSRFWFVLRVDTYVGDWIWVTKCLSAARLLSKSFLDRGQHQWWLRWYLFHMEYPTLAKLLQYFAVGVFRRRALSSPCLPLGHKIELSYWSSHNFR